MSIDGARKARALRRDLLLAFSLPTLVLGIMHGPQGQIQAIYAKHAGLALTALAAATLFSKIFDAVTYPLIGYLSDRAYARRGTRKDWVIAGTVVSVVGVWKLLRPPQEVDAVYFGIWMALTFLGWKIMAIPIQSWSYGLSADYAQRSRVQAWRGMAEVVGQLLFFALPFLAMKIGYAGSTELDFKALGFSAVVCAVALPLASLAAVAYVPDGGSAPPPAARRPGIAEVIDAIRANGPLQRLLAAALPMHFLGGMMGGVAYLYIDTYLGLGKMFPAIMFLSMLAGVAAIPTWSALAARYERHRVWAASLLACGMAALAFGLVSPGPSAQALTLLLYPAIMFTFSGSVIIFIMSADIVDYGRLSTGQDHSGLYGSIFAFLQKSISGLSAAAGLALVGLLGFDATATTQSANGIAGIKLAGAFLPALGLLSAAVIIWNYSLTRARLDEIQAQLALRD